jgi:NADH-quinone oxidoreductase subunit D
MTAWISMFCLAPRGDCYDRLMAWTEEIRQSARIMKQWLNAMPCGPVASSDRKVVSPPRAEMKQSMEELVHHFKPYTEEFPMPAGEVYIAIESPKVEFGAYLVLDRGNMLYRSKIRSTGFPHLQAMDFMMHCFRRDRQIDRAKANCR